MKLHIEYCKEFGLSQDEIENEEESEGRLPLGGDDKSADIPLSLYGIHEVKSVVRIVAVALTRRPQVRSRCRTIGGLAGSPDRVGTMSARIRFDSKKTAR